VSYYNFERPHRGNRTRGRIPAAIFYQARPDTAKRWTPMTSTQQPDLSELILGRKV
jgi:hypothetical protein